jgi:D-alanine-D-alanine ligase
VRIGLSCDLKESLKLEPGVPDDAYEEYDSPKTIEIIVSALKSKGHSVTILGGGSEFLDNVRREKVDFVFNIAEGRGTYRSREAQIPSVLEMLDIPYTGSDPQCLAISLDKPLTKKLAVSFGVSTPQWLIVSSGDELSEPALSKMPFPAIVKPAFEGSSKGIRLTALAHNVQEAKKEAARQLEVYKQPVMVEEFIDGDEITVGMIGNSPPKIVGMMRIIPRKKDAPFVYSVEVKRDYLNLVDYECPARLEQKILDTIADSSVKIFKGLECRDFARVDFRIARDGTAHFLEVNPLPGLGNYSDLVIMALKMGWTHEGLITAVFDAAFERSVICRKK